MARGVNKVILIGNMGADPEVRYMPTGGAVANITVATSESWTDKQTGEKKEQTEWHRCVAYQRLAEIIGEYTRKGSKVYIEGKLKTRKWQDQQGVERYTTEVIIDELQMLDSQQAGQGAAQGGQQQPRQTNQAPVQGGQNQQQYAGPSYQAQQQQQQRPQGQQQQQRPYNQPQGGYNANGSAAPNMHGVNQNRPQQAAQQGFGPNNPQHQPAQDYDDDIPF